MPKGRAKLPIRVLGNPLDRLMKGVMLGAAFWHLVCPVRVRFCLACPVGLCLLGGVGPSDSFGKVMVFFILSGKVMVYLYEILTLLEHLK